MQLDAGIIGIGVTLLGGLIAVSVRAGILSEKVKKLEEDLASTKVQFQKERDDAMIQHSKDINELERVIIADKDHNDKRIAELYDSRNEAKLSIVAITGVMTNLDKSVTEMKVDLKSFMEEMRKELKAR